jgi:hypothetical protein
MKNDILITSSFCIGAIFVATNLQTIFHSYGVRLHQTRNTASKVTVRNMATAQLFYLRVLIGNVNKISEITTGGFLRSECNRSKTAYSIFIFL